MIEAKSGERFDRAVLRAGTISGTVIAVALLFRLSMTIEGTDPWREAATLFPFLAGVLAAWLLREDQLKFRDGVRSMCIASAVMGIALFGYLAVQMGPGMFFVLLLVEGNWTLILLEVMLALASGLLGVAVTVGIRTVLQTRSKLRD